jgi:hypothetical protein
MGDRVKAAPALANAGRSSEGSELSFSGSEFIDSEFIANTQLTPRRA